MSESNKNAQYQALLDSIPQAGLKCDLLFLVIKNRIQEEHEYVKRLRVIFQFNILKNQKLAAVWTCDTKSSLEGDVYRGPPRNGSKADCVLTVDDDDWVRMMMGKLNPQRAFMMSKFKVKGNIMLLQKLHSIWFDLRRAGRTPELDLLEDIIVNEQLMPGLKSETMAIEIVQRIVKSPHLADKINANIQLNVCKHGQAMTKYLICVHPGKKPVFRRLLSGSTEQVDQELKPDIIFTIDDNDLVLIIYGIYKVEMAITTGIIHVEGNIEFVKRAKDLFEQPPILSKL